MLSGTGQHGGPARGWRRFGGPPPSNAGGAGGGGSKIGDRTRGPLLFAVGFIAVSLLVWAQTLFDVGVSTFSDRTLGYQAGRDSPFSIWGQTNGIEFLRPLILLAVALLSILFAFRPREKSLPQVAALGAALLIGLQLTAQHWFYLYIVWFLPLVLVALAAIRSAPEAGPDQSTPPARPGEHSLQHPSPTHPHPRSQSEPASV